MEEEDVEEEDKEAELELVHIEEGENLHFFPLYGKEGLVLFLLG